MTWNPAEYSNDALGPVGLADARLLDAVAGYVLPDLVVEFGSLDGRSAEVLLPHCRKLICVDAFPGSRLLEVEKRSHGRMKVVASRIEQYRHDPHEGAIEFLFIDAGHVYEENWKAWLGIEEHLSETHLVVVHDTGMWSTDHMSAVHRSIVGLKDSENGVFPHRPGERQFVRYLSRIGYRRVDFGTTRKMRHGMTILQKDLDV